MSKTFELNSALIEGSYFKAKELLESGAQPDKDTLLCALFSDCNNPFTLKFNDTYYSTIIELLLSADVGLDITSVQEYLLYAAQPLYVHQLTGAALPDNYSVEFQDALDYARRNLTHLSMYGDFPGLQQAVAAHEIRVKIGKAFELSKEYKNSSHEDLTVESFIDWVKKFHSESLEIAEKFAEQMINTKNDPMSKAIRRIDAKQMRKPKDTTRFFNGLEENDNLEIQSQGWNIPEIDFPDEERQEKNAFEY